MAEKKRGPGRPPGSKNKNTKSQSNSKSATAKSTPKTKQEQIREMQDKRGSDYRTIDIVWGLSIVAIGVFFFFTIVLDNTGALGRAVHDICLGLFGIMAYVLPFFFIFHGGLLIFQKLQHFNVRTVTFAIFIFLSICLLNCYRFIDAKSLHYGFSDITGYYREGIKGNYGGAVGMEIGSILVRIIGKPGLIIFSIALLVISLLLVANTPLSKWISNLLENHERKRLIKELEAAESKKQLMAAHEQAMQDMPQDTFFTYSDPAKYGEQSRFLEKKIEPPIMDLPSNYRSVDDSTTIFDVPIAKTSNSPREEIISSETAAKNEKKRSIFANLFKDSNQAVGRDVEAEKESLEEEKIMSDYRGAKPQEVKVVDNGLNSTNSSDGYGLTGLGNVASASSGGYGLGGSTIDKTAAAVGLSAGVALAGLEHGIASSEKSELDDIKNEIKQKKKNLGNHNLSDSLEYDSPAARKAQARNELQESIDTDDVASEINSGSHRSGTQEIYQLTPYDLLRKGRGGKQMMTEYQLEQRAQLLKKTLNDFGVDCSILSVTQGASVTRYEVQPATGVKVSKITGLADDIALNLRAKSIRIEAPIPGKAAVGIEVENDKPAPVLIRELIESKEFKESPSKLSFVVGKDISNNNILADLKDMPHLLIAGATGSGKSVCINSIIASFLYKAKPSEVKLIMIDPKVVELGNYNGIPHLLTSVVTDPRKASRALGEAVAEMNKRYEEFAKTGVKDLFSYNEFMIANQEPQACKPQIVIIIDELADLMMAAPSQVEESICRLAQKARAAGMHLIVATQRPSVDVVTGLIKANIPSRIAFSVASQVDSRTILDMAGAEKLLGKGDMLFSPVGSTKPYRVQGPFISDAETKKLISFWQNQGKPEYDENLGKAIELGDTKNDAPEDELTEDAIAFILKSKQASVSMLQRRFRIGYNRAARIIDEIEAKGIIGPSDGSRPRQVLMTEDDYYGSEVENETDEASSETSYNTDSGEIKEYE